MKNGDVPSFFSMFSRPGITDTSDPTTDSNRPAHRLPQPNRSVGPGPEGPVGAVGAVGPRAAA